MLGTIGTVCWCIQLVPQVYINWRRKKTDGLPGLMLLIWAICAVPFGVYAIAQNLNIPIQVQPQVFGVLSLFCWAQTLVYHDGWRLWTASLLATTLGACMGGVEVLLVLTLRPVYGRGVEWPISLIGVVAAVLLAMGLIPPYFELWKRRGRVVGIHFGFLTIDWMGAFFSLMSLIAQNSFDILGGVLYIICMLLELGIFASHFIWLWRTRDVRGEAKRAGKTYDEWTDQIYQDPSAAPATLGCSNPLPIKKLMQDDTTDTEKGEGAATQETDQGK